MNPHILDQPLRPYWRLMAKHLRAYVYKVDGFFGGCWRHDQYLIRIGPLTFGLSRHREQGKEKKSDA